MDENIIDKILNRSSGHNFHNRSKFNFKRLRAEPDKITINLSNYIAGFSADAREIVEKFKFDVQIMCLDDKNLLFLVLKKFEELIRKFSEISNETAGEHFTPREFIRLMVNILFINDRDMLSKKGIIKTLYDCAAGTGRMLPIAEEYLKELNERKETSQRSDIVYFKWVYGLQDGCYCQFVLCVFVFSMLGKP